MEGRNNQKHKKLKIRHVVQGLIFLLILAISINKQMVENGGGIVFLSSASLHSICPFGGVVSIYNLLTVGTFVQKIHISALLLMGTVFFLAVLFGPVFCGWLCPLGTIQEWIGKLGKRVFKKRYNRFVPVKYDKYLRYFRIFVLIWVVIKTAQTGILLFTNIDPYYALFNFYTGEVAIQALSILTITLIASLFIERPWCKYACPYGALLGFTNKIKIFKPFRNEKTCISCGICDSVCPMNIEVSNSKSIKQIQCISCFECTSENSCPVPEVVEIKWRG